MYNVTKYFLVLAYAIMVLLSAYTIGRINVNEEEIALVHAKFRLHVSMHKLERNVEVLNKGKN